jgi:hypothetical protein
MNDWFPSQAWEREESSLGGNRVGKKSRKSKQKPRSTTLFLDMGKPVALNRAVFGKNGSIIVESAAGQEQPIASHVVTTYERAKGPKVIHQLTVPSENLTFDPNFALTRYSWVLAIDTNNPENCLPNVVFTGIVHTNILPHTDSILKINIYRGTVLELHNLNCPPERFGWAFVCKSVINLPQQSLVAVIVDSDLRSIPSINRREEPIIDDYYLPDSFELLYATDKGGYIANQLLRLCDRNTREVARHVATQTSSLPPLMEAHPEDPFTHIRVWQQSMRSSA